MAVEKVAREMIRKLSALSFGLFMSQAVFASFAGQDIRVDWLLDNTGTIQVQSTTTLTAPGSTVFELGSGSGQTCNIAVSDTAIQIGACNFPSFGNCSGACTYNGFSFTDLGSAPEITAVTSPGVVDDANTVSVNLIGQSLQNNAVTLDVTFAPPPPPSATPVPVLSPFALALAAGGMLMAGLGAARRRHKRQL